jgi:hypothetical protein
MRLRAKVVATMQQWLAIVRASTLVVGARPNTVLLKFATSEDRHVVLRGHKGLMGTKLSLDKDFKPAQQARKSELWPLFKEAKAVGKCAFWRAAELFINNTWICPPSSI